MGGLLTLTLVWQLCLTNCISCEVAAVPTVMALLPSPPSAFLAQADSKLGGVASTLQAHYTIHVRNQTHLMGLVCSVLTQFTTDGIQKGELGLRTAYRKTKTTNANQLVVMRFNSMRRGSHAQTKMVANAFIISAL